jgi:hypothetical protein
MDGCYDFFKYFRQKLAKNAFLTQNKAKLWTILIITLVFVKNVHFFGKNWQKSPKIVIITSAPGRLIFFTDKLTRKIATLVEQSQQLNNFQTKSGLARTVSCSATT